MIKQAETTENINENFTGYVYIYSNMCGTCMIAEKMLTVIETAFQPNIWKINGNYFPEFLQINQVLSIPALLVYKNGKIVERVFAFKDVMYLRSLFLKYK